MEKWSYLKLHARVDCTEVNQRAGPRPPSTIPHIYAFDRSRGGIVE